MEDNLQKSDFLAQGFTLIELLVVIAIIGFLASFLFASFSYTQTIARDMRRVREVKQVQELVEMYAVDHNRQYPVTPEGWWGSCAEKCGHDWGKTTDDWVPNLVAEGYVPKLPLDPKPADSCSSCYLYLSDGVNYKILIHVPENCESGRKLRIVDSARNCWAWAFYSPGGVNW